MVGQQLMAIGYLLEGSFHTVVQGTDIMLQSLRSEGRGYQEDGSRGGILYFQKFVGK